MKKIYPKEHTVTLNGMKIKLSLWSKKIKSLLEQIGLRRILDESTLCGHRNRKRDQAMT